MNMTVSIMEASLIQNNCQKLTMFLHTLVAVDSVRLANFIVSDDFKKLPIERQELFKEQSLAMDNCIASLRQYHYTIYNHASLIGLQITDLNTSELDSGKPEPVKAP